MINVLEDTYMVHQINDLNNIKSISSDSRLQARNEELKDASSGSPAANDKSVSFSKTSKNLEALIASLADEPEVNEARVLYFKSEINAGTYQIHSDRIALNMVQNMELI